ASPRALARSYIDPYVDYTGRVTGYAVVDLRVLGTYDWRLAAINIWKVERQLLEHPHRRLYSSDARYTQLRHRSIASRQRHNGRKPLNYRGRNRWTEIPSEFTADATVTPRRSRAR